MKSANDAPEPAISAIRFSKLFHKRSVTKKQSPRAFWARGDFFQSGRFQSFRFFVGLGTAAFVAFIARATHPAYTATQFALFTSLAAVPRTVINASAGWLVENLGWLNFFLLCVVLAVPGMLLLFRVAPWNEPGTTD